MRTMIPHFRPQRLTLCLMFALCLGLAACATSGVMDERSEAVRLYRYQGLRDELIVEPAKLSTVTVRAGDRITREVPFALLSPQRDKKFLVSEIVTLTGPSLAVDLSKQESERTQGLHTSTLQVVVPKDLPPGIYTIVTKIATEEQQVTQRANFQVIR